MARFFEEFESCSPHPNLLKNTNYQEHQEHRHPWYYRTKKTVENCDSFYLDIGLTNTGALGTAHYSHPTECYANGCKCLWEFLILN
ncbi:MAG: hypothetical protein F6K39_25770, partial [Okeania sp. SIO3B3]|nr:hypothetical protein [Okeania sp. SIO3B3]